MKIITTWEELAELAKTEPSKTHTIDINFNVINGWIEPIGESSLGTYLSTHTFYEGSEIDLRKYGWDAKIVGKY